MIRNDSEGDQQASVSLPLHPGRVRSSHASFPTAWPDHSKTKGEGWASAAAASSVGQQVNGNTLRSCQVRSVCCQRGGGIEAWNQGKAVVEPVVILTRARQKPSQLRNGQGGFLHAEKRAKSEYVHLACCVPCFCMLRWYLLNFRQKDSNQVGLLI